MTSPIDPHALALTSSEVSLLFPYSFAVSKAGCIVNRGSALAPLIGCDAMLDESFEPIDLGRPPSLPAAEGMPPTCLLRLRQTGLVLQGWFVPRSWGRIFIAQKPMKPGTQDAADNSKADTDAQPRPCRLPDDGTCKASQSEMVSIVSHEFRTPLTAMDGTLFLLRRILNTPGVVSDAQSQAVGRWLNLMGTAIVTLKELVDQVLTYSRIERLNGATQCSAKHPGELLREIVSAMNSSLPEPRIELLDSLPMNYFPDIDTLVLRTAIENLVSNALKYSSPTSPVIVALDFAPGGWKVTVEDQGRGIPIEDQKKLFTPFHRASNVGGVPGSGLGLAIVQKAVSSHGGTLTFVSRENAGSRFEISFPTKPASEAQAITPHPIS